MARQQIRIAHYINQFFGGIGGEEKADAELQIREGPVGPGIGLQKALADRGQIVATLICGDNYFNSQTAAALAGVQETIERYQPDVVVAGPAFDAGRYGFACGEVGKAVSQRLGIPAATAMYPENPAVETYRKIRGIWILPTSARAIDMPKVLPKLADFAVKVGSGLAIGPARAEGYIPTGQRKLVFTDVPGAERALNMLLTKLAGQPSQTEIPIERFEPVPPAPPLKDLKTARLGVITTSGLVPKGNPDRFKMFNATEWRKYRLPDVPALEGKDWEVIHGGFNTAYAQANPNLVLPLDALRELEGQAFGELHHEFYTITGVGTSLKTAKQAGEEMAASMREAGVDAALLVAT
ncbi:MAG: glycine/betaine/sarcosine/D-proline family reductase selenoprotein B [Acidobacteria bacterium]|nr:glycine/betaine/sarcosine/D-proline family reductase selenoprotein B [Acidobacteriota bacterium]